MTTRQRAAMPGPWPVWLLALGGVTLSSPSSAIDPGRAEGFLVAAGDRVEITIEGIGTLENSVAGPRPG